MYDQCDTAGRIAYLGEDNIILGAGYYGMYNVTDTGKTVNKLDVFYCKTVGYGAPEKAGDVNTLICTENLRRLILKAFIVLRTAVTHGC